jgi:hypothetical protein
VNLYTVWVSDEILYKDWGIRSHYNWLFNMIGTSTYFDAIMRDDSSYTVSVL